MPTPTRIVPVYPLTANITQRWLRRLMYEVITYSAPRVADPLPKFLRNAAELIDLPPPYSSHIFPPPPISSERLATASHLMKPYAAARRPTQKRIWQLAGVVYETPEDWLQ